MTKPEGAVYTNNAMIGHTKYFVLEKFIYHVARPLMLTMWNTLLEMAFQHFSMMNIIRCAILPIAWRTLTNNNFDITYWRTLI